MKLGVGGMGGGGGFVEDVTARGWWEIIAGHNNWQPGESGPRDLLHGRNERNLVWLGKESQIRAR